MRTINPQLPAMRGLLFFDYICKLQTEAASASNYIEKHIFMNNIQLNPSMKFSDLLNFNPELILLLTRFHIPLGFGEKTVEEICAEQKLSANLFLLICKVYSIKGYEISREEAELTEMGDLLLFLSDSHRYYLEERLPHIALHLKHIAEQCTAPQGRLLKQFYEEYRNEVIAHFEYEEKTVFPYIRALMEGKTGASFRIREFESNHSNIEEKLQDLVSILIKYLPAESSPQERISITMDIYHLTEDINRHSLLEDKILVCYASIKEGRNHGKTK